MAEPDRISYDLLHERWIPCERPDGSRVLVGIEEALVEAHTFAAMHDESPLATATLHRLLLAILHRVFFPKNQDDWVGLWNAPTFDAQRIRAYLDKWKERFDLFHPERPFLQVANLADVLRTERGTDPEPTEAWRLAIEQSSYSNATDLFEPLPSDAGLSPPRAVLALLAFLAYTPGGRIQNETASWGQGSVRGGAVVLVRGETLHRTLTLNLVCQPDRRSHLDIPPWERERSTQRIAREPYGTVDLLVWVARRVALIPTKSIDGRVSVDNVVTAAGEWLKSDVPDPMFGYVVRDPKKPPVAIRIRTERGVWRDAAALFDAATGADAFRRPAACEQLDHLVREEVVPRNARFQVELLGPAHDPPKPLIHLWRTDRMPLPPSLLAKGARISALRAALSFAEDLAKGVDFEVLNTLAENALAPGDREAHKDDIRSLKLSLGVLPNYWATLGRAFPIWLDGLGHHDDLDGHVAQWRQMLRATTRDVVTVAMRHLGSTARALQAGAKAERALTRVLAKILGPEFGPPVASGPTATTAAEGVSA